MNRKIVLITGIITAIFLSMPIIFGFFIENKVNKLLFSISERTLNQDSIVKLNFDSLVYKKGWFSSEARVSGRIIPKKNVGFVSSAFLSVLDDKGNDFNLNMKISHGPFLFLFDVRHDQKLGATIVKTEGNITIQAADNKKEKFPVKIISSIGFKDSIHHELQLPSHKQPIGRLLSIEWLDTDVEFSHTIDFSEYEWEIELDNFQIRHQLFGSLVIKDLDLRRAIAELEDEKYSSRSIIADEVNLKGIGGNEVFFEEFSNEIITTVKENDLATFSMLLNVDKVKATRDEYGETFIAIQGENFKATPFDQLMNNLSNLGIKNKPDDIFMLLQQTVTEDTNIFIKPIKFNSEKGKLEVSGKIKPKYPWPAKFDSVNNLWDLADSISLEVKGPQDVARFVAKQAIKYEMRQEMLDKAKSNKKTNANKYVRKSNDLAVTEQMVSDKIKEWELAGIVMVQKEDYRLKFSYSNSQFNFNGNIL